jgi:hypothetical protein
MYIGKEGRVGWTNESNLDGFRDKKDEEVTRKTGIKKDDDGLKYERNNFNVLSHLYNI